MFCFCLFGFFTHFFHAFPKKSKDNQNPSKKKKKRSKEINIKLKHTRNKTETTLSARIRKNIPLLMNPILQIYFLLQMQQQPRKLLILLVRCLFCPLYTIHTQIRRQTILFKANTNNLNTSQYTKKQLKHTTKQNNIHKIAIYYVLYCCYMDYKVIFSVVSIVSKLQSLYLRIHASATMVRFVDYLNYRIEYIHHSNTISYHLHTKKVVSHATI